MADSDTTPSHTAIAEIDHGPSKLDQFLDQHQSKLVIAAILIALGVIAYVVYSGLEEGKAQEAGAALVSAETSAELESVISTWSGSNSSATALMLLSETQSETDAAISKLKQFINEHPEHPALATAKVNLGIKLLKNGNNNEARDILAEVADNEAASYIAPFAAITLGDIAKEAGDAEKATTWYQKAKTDDNELGNSFTNIAESRLLLVNAQPPTKVQPALPEPPTAPAIPADPTPAIPTTPTPQSITPPLPTPVVPETP